MKEYKLEILNKEMHLTRQKDIDDAQAIIDRYVREGWEVQQIITPNDGLCSMFGLFVREF